MRELAQEMVLLVVKGVGQGQAASMAVGLVEDLFDWTWSYQCCLESVWQQLALLAGEVEEELVLNRDWAKQMQYHWPSLRLASSRCSF